MLAVGVLFSPMLFHIAHQMSSWSDNMAIAPLSLEPRPTSTGYVNTGYIIGTGYLHPVRAVLNGIKKAVGNSCGFAIAAGICSQALNVDWIQCVTCFKYCLSGD